MMNGFIGGFGMQPQPGMVSGVNDQRNYCQTLTAEQANVLRKRIEEFSLAISEKDKWAAWCMHRDPQTGASTMMPDKIGGGVTCSICGKSWRLLDNLAKQDVINAVNSVLDIIQTSKSLYLDMPAEAARNFFVIIALLEKIPGLYELASKNFSDHENVYRNINYANDPSTVSAWRTLNGGSYGGGFYMQAPYANPGFGYGYNPQMQQMPNGGQYMGQPVAPGQNPFFANGQAPVQQQVPVAPQAMPQQAPVAPQVAPAAPQMGAPMMQSQMGYQPAIQNYVYTPNQATQAATVAPAAPVMQPQPPATPGTTPVAQQAATDGSTVQVNNTFQA